MGSNGLGSGRAGNPGALARWGLLLATFCSLVAEPAAASTCEPWPGEPDPLPALKDPDPLRAEWAELRARELATLARRLEERDPLRARQLWRRLLCMDPANDQALVGVLRSPAVQVHRPELRDAAFEDANGREPWKSLDAPLGVKVDRSAERRAEARAARLRELRRAVAAVQSDVRAARFDAALASSAALRPQLAAAPRGSTRRGLIVETEVLAATAELALGRENEAVASLRRALTAEPGLELDPSRTSPKVVRALEAARGETTP